ncbi:MAG: hypothetical protein J2P37_31845 [Ktedonobacteraceae bacterium]|nr:hypothetical protein [Ktedonobacteraceae bacterium]MBO0794585.1 hypothetical protein [Ktedonobacteraceae bacterium]
MKTPRKHYKVSNGEVQLAVSETGQGQTLLFFNGGDALRRRRHERCANDAKHPKPGAGFGCDDMITGWKQA